MTILPPYVPSKEEKADPGLYAKNVQALYAKTLGVPIVDQVRQIWLHCLLVRHKCASYMGLMLCALPSGGGVAACAHALAAARRSREGSWACILVCMQWLGWIVSAAVRALLQSQEEFTALFKRGITVSLDGRRVVAPEGVLDNEGFVDLTAELPRKAAATKKRD